MTTDLDELAAALRDHEHHTGQIVRLRSDHLSHCVVSSCPDAVIDTLVAAGWGLQREGEMGRLRAIEALMRRCWDEEWFSVPVHVAADIEAALADGDSGERP